MSEMFADLFQLHSFFTLLMLILLQAVLGFDNLLYISLESKRVKEEDQARVRFIGISLAIFLRIALLFVVKFAVDKFQNPFFTVGNPPETPTQPGHVAEVTSDAAAEAAQWLVAAVNLVV